MKPTIMPIIATGGKEYVASPVGAVPPAAFHPNDAEISSKMSNEAVAVIVPFTVITFFDHGVVGPSLTGALSDDPVETGAVCPPRTGAAHPAASRFMVSSLKTGLDMF
jgi:hypothetical protein